MKCSVFIATSVDGYIAKKDGSIDWLEESNKCIPMGEDCGYAEFMSTIDVIIMGRKTYETVLAFGFWPYTTLPVYVLSSQDHLPLPEGNNNITFLKGKTPKELVSLLREKGYNHAYVDGGYTIRSFLSEKLIHAITITRIPILLGSGIPLFGKNGIKNDLSHIKTYVYDFGYIQSTYQIL